MGIKLLIEEGETTAQPTYVHITETYAKILVAILECGTEEATPAVIAGKCKKDKHNIPASEVKKFIARASKDSRQFLATMEWAGSQTGAHTDLLEIRPDKLVTNPVSAFILKELAKFSKEIKSREVNKIQFQTHLKRQFSNSQTKFGNISEKDIKERLSFLISIGDIREMDTVSEIIWLDLIRFHSQKAYLDLLLSKFSPPSP